MTPGEIIQKAKKDRVDIQLFGDKIKATGPVDAVEKWRTTISENRDALVTEMRQRARLEIIRDASGRETGFALDGEPTQPGTQTPEPDHPETFDADTWVQRISATVEAVAAQDRGSLAHCREQHPDLHRQCLSSARDVDLAFELGDEKSLIEALGRFETLHQQARQFFQGGR